MCAYMYIWEIYLGYMAACLTDSRYCSAVYLHHQFFLDMAVQDLIWFGTVFWKQHYEQNATLLAQNHIWNIIPKKFGLQIFFNEIIR